MTESRGGAPANIDAERAVLGALLKDPGLINVHCDGLMPEDFYLEAHAHIYGAIRQVSESGSTVDVVTVGEQLAKNATLGPIGGVVALADLLDETATTVGVEHHAAIIREKSVVRRMITATTEIASRGYSPSIDVQEYLDTAQKELFDVLAGRERRGLRPISDVLGDTMRLLENQLREGADISGIPTGFDDLDALLLGLQRSDLLILAARPAMGKTAFALSIATHVALYEQRAVAVFSLEMGADQLAMRLMSSESHVDLKSIRGGRPSMDDFRRLTDAMAKLSQARLHIDDTPAISLFELRSRARRLSLEQGLDLILIDYLQLMRASTPTLSREQQISEISRGLKALAKELNIPVIALSQLNRGLESRTDKRPILSDLRESGAIEQDADVIMFIYRDEYYLREKSEKPGVAEIIVGKQRNGPTGIAELAFIGEYTKFANLTRKFEEY